MQCSPVNSDDQQLADEVKLEKVCCLLEDTRGVSMPAWQLGEVSVKEKVKENPEINAAQHG